MGVVVDSSIFVATQRRRFGWTAWIDSLGATELLVSSITLSELLHGAHRAASADQRAKRLRFAARLERDYCIVPFGVREAHTHACLHAAMQSQGEMIGSHDLLIAATACAHGHAVARLNLCDFQRVPDLTVLDAAPFLSPG